MSVAIRAITRLQDADDVNVTPAVGVDEYALTYDHDTGKFVLRAPAAPFDGTPYALLAGRAGGQTLYGGTAANEDITIHGTSDATRTTSYVLLQPTAGYVGIGTTAPTSQLHIGSSAYSSAGKALAVVGSIDQVNTDTTAYSATVYNSGMVRFAKIHNNGGADQYAGFVFQVSGNNATKNAVGQIHVLQEAANSDASSIVFQVRNAASSYLEVARFTSAGLVGIGTTAPATMLHVVSTTATTNALRNVITLGANVTSTGVGAAGLGGAILFTAESSTTVDTSQASIAALWYEATHATRKADLVLRAYDTDIREGLRIRGAGSEPAIGFYGVAPIARAILATGAGATADNIITALQNLGLVKQS